MPIQWKLLIVLLTVALPPLLILGFFDAAAMRQLGQEVVALRVEALSEKNRQDIEKEAKNRARLIKERQALLQSRLQQRALEAVSVLNADPALSLSQLAQHASRADTPLSTLSKTWAGQGELAQFRAITVHRLGSSGVESLPLWPKLETGEADRTELPTWMSRAIKNGPASWGWRGGKERPVLTLVTPLPKTGYPTALSAQVSLGAMVGELFESPEKRPPLGAALLFDGKVVERFGPSDTPKAILIGSAGQSSEDLVRAEAPIDETLGLSLVLIASHTGEAGELSQAEKDIQKRIQKQLVVGAVGVAILLGAAALLSLIGARSITSPVKNLTFVARRIAAGDLDARTDVRTGDELEDLAQSFNDMLPKLNDRIKMREALTLAMEVQQKLLPADAPTVAGLDIAGRSIYCDETGGDYYDFIEMAELDKRSVGVAVGDVTGHGVAAALLMATARALLRAHAGEPDDLSGMMTTINRHLSRDAHAGRFMTLFYLMIEQECHRLRWVSAGHAPALLYDPEEDSFTELAGGDIPLGVDGAWSYQEERRDGWKPGQIIAIGTDGVWEMRNPDGTMYGLDRLRQLIKERAQASADDICQHVADDLNLHRSHREQEDDVTLVVVKMP